MQMFARHLRIPGIVLLLLAGVVLGPDVLGVIDPGNAQGVVHGLVSFAVAVILSLGVVTIIVGKLVAIPIAKTVGQAMGDHREAAGNAKETTLLASRATESAKESAILAQKTIEVGERVADRLIEKLDRLS